MQTKKEYTPGPWRIKEDTHVHFIFPLNGEYPLAEVRTFSTSEGEANARLISAAPDLVEAVIGQAKVAAANEEIKESQAGWRGSAKELNEHCQTYANKHWRLYLTSSALAALKKAGVRTK